MDLITWNPSDKGTSVALSNNNLTATITHVSNGANTRVRATHGKTTGKWYWEVRMGVATTSPLIGIAQSDLANSTSGYASDKQRVYYAKTGYKYSSTNSLYGAAFGDTGDVISVLLDLEEGKLEFWKNGQSQGVAFTNLLDMTKPVFPYAYSGDNGTFVAITNFGATPFEYEIPEGYLPYDIDNARRLTTKTKHLIKSQNKIHTLLGEDVYKNLIPVMISNTLPSGNASTNSSYGSGYEAFRAFNGLLSVGTTHANRMWLTANSITKAWLSYKFPSPTKINSYNIQIGSHDIMTGIHDAKTRSPKSWTFEGRNGTENWVVLHSVENSINWEFNEKREFGFLNEIEYEEYRINVASVNGGANITIDKLEMGYQSSGELIYPNIQEPLLQEQYEQWGMDSLVGYGNEINKVFIEMNESGDLEDGRVIRKTIDKNEWRINSLSIENGKSLIKNSDKIYLLSEESEWVDTGLTEPLSKENFETYGMDSLDGVDSEKLKELEGEEFEVITWTDEESEEVPAQLEGTQVEWSEEGKMFETVITDNIKIKNVAGITVE